MDSTGLISFIGIIVALVVLIWLAYQGFTVMVLAPLAAIIIAVFSRQGIYETLSTTYIQGYAGFITANCLILLMSAIFGKFMDESGAARGIGLNVLKLCNLFPEKSRRTVAVVCMSMINAILTYGGISLFVVTFTTVSIAKTLFEKMDIPWSLTMASALGSATFTMTMLPGSPQLTNLVPTSILGTTPMAAPTLGIIASVIMVVLGVLYISYAIKKYDKRGEGFLPSGAEIAKVIPSMDLETSANIIVCLLPCIILLVVMNAFSVPPVMALIVGCIACYLIFFKEFKGKDLKPIFFAGCQNAMLAVSNTASIFGFGKVVSAAAGFSFIVGALDKLPGPPIVQMIVAVEIAAGITGSSSGGVGIALNAMGQRFLDMGIAPQAVHRLSAIAAGGLDSLPHTTGLQASLAANRLTVKDGYIHMFWESVLIPIVVVIIVSAIHAATGIL